MNRAEAAARVALIIPAVLRDAGIATSDTPEGLEPALDAALSALGLLSDQETEDAVGFVALVKYHALLMAEGRMADRFDVTTPGGSYRLQQAVATVQKMIERSEKEVSALFGSVSATGPGTWDLGFLTPR